MSRMRLLALALGWMVLSGVSSGTAVGSGEAGPIVRVGQGSYTTALPAGAKSPQSEIFQTDNVKGKMPTNDWWSSVAWLKFSERQYPHPLAVQASADGLRVFYPAITATKDAIFGFMPPKAEDLILGHSAGEPFADARVDGFSDWFVRVRFGTAGKGMTVSYGHGSPYVYAMYDGGSTMLSFTNPPKVWSGDEKSAVLGISVGNKHYGLFGPAGSKWEGLGGKSITNQAGGKRYFSLALLPEATEKTLTLFRRYAYAHVTDSRVDFKVDVQSSEVTTTFAVTTHAYEGDAKGTVFSLYPHQWRNTKMTLLDGTYNSVRGAMKLAQGESFSVSMKYPGVLPSIPVAGKGDAERMRSYVKDEAGRDDTAMRDTYWDGKQFGRQTTVASLAAQYGMEAEEKAIRDRIRGRLEDWLSAANADGKPKQKRLFQYNEKWGTLIGYPASYGSDNELNDHHFHYGYFLVAAAEIAGRDPAWAADAKWGGMIKLIIRDIACFDRSDAMFPMLRNFDPYAGHSWAAGHARFGDGNNQESSSEAMNAWYGMILWGEATGDTKTRDLGIWLYTTEMNAIQEYWFDVHGDNFPKTYTPSVVTMVWGGKGANGTWFSGDPEAVHGINYLPVTGGSLYLGLYPDYAKKNYDALRSERKGPGWKQWADIIWMFRALSDPDDAMKQMEAAGEKFGVEAGNSRASTYQWIHSLSALGEVDRTVTADHAMYAVFKKGMTRSYVAYNGRAGSESIKFSDGYELKPTKHGFVVGNRAVADAPGK